MKVCLALVGLLLLAGCEISNQVSPEERRLFLTVEDYQHHGIDVVANKRPVFQRIVNRVYRTAEYSYVYDDTEHGLYVQSSLKVVAPLSFSTRMTERAQREAVLVTMKAGGVIDEPLPHQRQYGKQSHLGLLKYQGKPIGNLFSMAVDNKVYLVLCSGIYYEDGEAFHAVIADKVAAVERYSIGSS